MGNDDDEIEAGVASAATEYYRHKGFSGAATRLATARYIAALEAQVAMLKRQSHATTRAMLASLSG